MAIALKLCCIFLTACMPCYLSYQLGKELHGIDVVKKRIVKAFDNIDWTRQSFLVSGEQLKDSKGNVLFYPAPPIDDAIKKLNETLDDIE